MAYDFFPVTNFYKTQKYMRTVYYNNGAEPYTSEQVVEWDVNKGYLPTHVEDWNRQGQSMKNFKSKSHVNGYDYWITPDQAEFNKKAKVFRKEENEIRFS